MTARITETRADELLRPGDVVKIIAPGMREHSKVGRVYAISGDSLIVWVLLRENPIPVYAHEIRRLTRDEKGIWK